MLDLFINPCDVICTPFKTTAVQKGLLILSRGTYNVQTQLNDVTCTVLRRLVTKFLYLVSILRTKVQGLKRLGNPVCWVNGEQACDHKHRQLVDLNKSDFFDTFKSMEYILTIKYMASIW